MVCVLVRVVLFLLTWSNYRYAQHHVTKLVLDPLSGCLRIWTDLTLTFHTTSHDAAYSLA